MNYSFLGLVKLPHIMKIVLFTTIRNEEISADEEAVQTFLCLVMYMS